jgi:predicted small secreted protein
MQRQTALLAATVLAVAMTAAGCNRNTPATGKDTSSTSSTTIITNHHDAAGEWRSGQHHFQFDDHHARRSRQHGWRHDGCARRRHGWRCSDIRTVDGRRSRQRDGKYR